MKVIVTGSSGLIGSAAVRAFREANHDVLRLVRQPSGADSNAVFWDPEAGVLDPKALEGADALLHLSGANLAAGRWTTARKRLFYDSRVQSTELASKVLTGASDPPRVWLCASAVGYYGDRGDAVLTEADAPGSGFLPDLCVAWERATRPAADRGIRVVHLRFGMVLSREGGAVSKLLPIFRMGLGGVLGTGRQYMSWITLRDAVRAILFALEETRISGPVNTVAPAPVTNREFTKVLGRVLRRPTVFRAPAVALRAMYGEMADAVLLASTRAIPQKLQQHGFSFMFPDIESGLSTCLCTAPHEEVKT